MELEFQAIGHSQFVPSDVTRVARWAQFPGCQITMGAPNHCSGRRKSLNNVASTFFNAVYLLPKDLRFEHGGAKLASCPGRCLTSLRPCLHQSDLGVAFRSMIENIARWLGSVLPVLTTNIPSPVFLQQIYQIQSSYNKYTKSSKKYTKYVPNLSVKEFKILCCILQTS